MKICIALAVLIIGLYAGSVQDLITAMTPTETSPGCVSFSPFVTDGDLAYNPGWGPTPPKSLVTTLLNILHTQTSFRCIQIYDMGGASQVYNDIVEVADALGIKVLGHVYLNYALLEDGTLSEELAAANEKHITGAIATALNYPDTVIGCGSEMAYENNNLPKTLEIVTNCITKLRDAEVTQPLGYIDVGTVLCGSQEYPCTKKWKGMENIVDWIGLDEFPWWKNTFSKVFTCVPIENAANLTTFIYENVKNAYTKPVLLTEFGWPGTSGEDRKSAPNKYTGEECGIANPANQIRANQEVLDYCATHNLPCTVFEAFNELWKGSNAHDINAYWGFCSGYKPYDCANVPLGFSHGAVTTTPEPSSTSKPSTTKTATKTPGPSTVPTTRSAASSGTFWAVTAALAVIMSLYIYTSL